AAIGWVALAYVFVLCVSACSITVDPLGSTDDHSSTPTETATGYTDGYKESLLRDLAHDGDSLCFLFRENGAESVARILNRADTDVTFNRFTVQRVLSEECDQ